MPHDDGFQLHLRRVTVADMSDPQRPTSLATPNQHRWEEQLLTQGRTVISTSVGRLVLALVGALLFTLIGLGMLTSDSVIAKIGGGLCVLFFGVIGIPSLIWQMARRVKAVVTLEGVGLGKDFVSWREVFAVALWEHPGGRVCMLTLTDEGAARQMAEASPAMRLLLDRDRKIVGAPAFSLPTTLKAPIPELTAWLTTVHERYYLR